MRLAALAICISLSAPLPAAAAPTAVKVAFSGTITSLSPGYDIPGIFVGDAVAGVLVYDPTTADGQPLSWIGYYGDAIKALSVTIGSKSYSLAAPPSSEIDVINDDLINGSYYDTLLFRAAVFEPAVPAVTRFFQLTFGMSGVVPQTFLTSDALPANPALGNVPVRTGFITYLPPGASQGNNLTLSSVRVVARWRDDFDGDGRADILWRNSATGENYLYPMNGTTILGTEGYLRTVADQNWQVAGTGDFDGDGRSDILWRNSSTGENYLYPMNGTTILGTEGYLRTVADQSWQVAGIGDFDGDGRSDVLWRNSGSGENYVYLMNGKAIAGEGYLRTVADLNWKVAGVGDFNGDGNDDILWRNAATGENYFYPMNGTAILAAEGYIRTVADLNWKVVGTGDFDGDGKADVLWRNSSTGENYLYPMNGTAILGTEGYIRTVADQNWKVQATGDYDGDGKADVLWRNSSTGENYLYFMDGTTIKPAEGYTRTVADSAWQPAGGTASLSACPGGPMPATGQIAVVSAASLADGETFTLHDGYVARVFEYNKTGSVAAGHIGIAVGTGSETASQIAFATSNAVNNAYAGSLLKITAQVGGTSVLLTHAEPGSHGNQPVLESVSNASFVVQGMSGGCL